MAQACPLVGVARGAAAQPSDVYPASPVQVTPSKLAVAQHLAPILPLHADRLCWLVLAQAHG